MNTRYDFFLAQGSLTGSLRPNGVKAAMTKCLSQQNPFVFTSQEAFCLAGKFCFASLRKI